jgi:hypothetical protein
MKGADGNEELSNLTLTVSHGANGTQLYEYSVLNWRDPIVTNVTPVENSTGVPLVGLTVTTEWNQSMATDSCISLVNASAVVITGTCSYNDSTKTITFTPSSGIMPDTVYTATAAGLIDAVGDYQQTVNSWSFTTNIPPVVDPINDQAVDELVELAFTVTAHDLDEPAQTLTFCFITAPEGASINATTGEFTWTPTEAQGPTTSSVEVCVYDGDMFGFGGGFTIQVNEVNMDPTLDPIGNQSVAVGETLTFTSTASDGDLPAQTLTFSLDGAPAGALIDPATGEFSWDTTGVVPGNFTFDVCVSDGVSTVCETILVTITEVPDPLPIKIYLPVIFR